MVSKYGIPDDFFPPYIVREPEKYCYPVVLDIPHAGSLYPDDFINQTCLEINSLRQAEDAFVDELYQEVFTLGISLLKARFPRTYLDLNRDMHEFDPKLYNEKLPSHYKTHSVRVSNGLGVIPRTAGEGIMIYDRKRRLDDDLVKIEHLYKPYHQRLRHMMHLMQNKFGKVLLINCHSMPSRTFLPDLASRPPDIVLGNRYGTSCHNIIMNSFEKAFQNYGYHVARNRPYAGAFITECYGAPSQNRHTLQIEINRMLYMDEKKVKRYPDKMNILKGNLKLIFAQALAEWVGH